MLRGGSCIKLRVGVSEVFVALVSFFLSFFFIGPEEEIYLVGKGRLWVVPAPLTA